MLVLPMYSVQPFRNGSVFEDFSVSKIVVGSIIMSLHSKVVLGSKLCKVGRQTHLTRVTRRRPDKMQPIACVCHGIPGHYSSTAEF